MGTCCVAGCGALNINEETGVMTVAGQEVHEGDFMSIDGVTGTATHFILKKYKDHGTAFAVKKEDEREMITP